MGIDISPALAESAGFAALSDWEAGPSADVREKLGMASLTLEDGGVLSVREDPTRFWSKALGFGFERPVTGELIEEIGDFYLRHGASAATIQLAPSALPADWERISAAANLSAASTWVRVACETDVALAHADAKLDEGLRVAPVDADQATEWAAIESRVFSMTDAASSAIFAASVGRAGWHTFAVWAGEEMIAVATMYVHGATASFMGGATLPEYRRRGAQTALITARAQAARAAGCRWLLAETGAEEPGQHNASLHNLRRAGFEVLYERVNWRWQRPAGSSPM